MTPATSRGGAAAGLSAGTGPSGRGACVLIGRQLRGGRPAGVGQCRNRRVTDQALAGQVGQGLAHLLLPARVVGVVDAVRGSELVGESNSYLFNHRLGRIGASIG